MGYDTFKTKAAAKKAYRRRRVTQFFILTGELGRTRCAVCGKALDDHGDEPEGYRGNRCTYHPKTKQVKAMHYVCAWGCIFDGVARLGEVC